MKNMFSRSKIEKTPAAKPDRNAKALRLAYILFGGLTLTIPVIFYLTWQSRIWQLFVLSGALLTLVGVFFAAIQKFRRGHMDPGAWMIIYSTLGTITVGGIFLAGMGWMQALIGIVLSLILAYQFLPENARTRAIAVGFGVGIISVVVDLFQFDFRLSVPELQTFIPGISVSVFVVVGFIIFRQTWQSNIRAKLVSSFLLITLLSLAVASFLIVQNTSNTLTRNARQNLQSAAEKTASDLDSFIENNLDVILTESQNPTLVDYLTLPARERPGSAQEAQAIRLLHAMSRRDPVYITSYAVFDLRGKDVLDTFVDDIGLIKSDRIYFQEPLKSGLPFASEVQYAETTGEASIYFSSPIRNEYKEIIGLLRVRFNAGILQKIIAKTNGLAGEDSAAILLDENHFRLADGEGSRFLYSFTTQVSEEKISQLQEARRLPRVVPDEIVFDTPAFEAGLNNVDVISFFDAELHGADAHGNVDHLESIAVVRMENQPWLVGFAQAKDTFLAPVETQVRYAIFLALIISAVVVLAAYFIANYLANPISHLTEVASQVSAGNFNVQAVVETNDEIGILAKTFNDMTSQLREFIMTLEERVAQRTQALATSSEISRRLSSILDRNTLAVEVVEQLKSAFNYYHAHIYLVDESGDRLVMTGGTGEVGKTLLSRGHTIQKGKGLVGRAAESKEAILVTDTSRSPDWLPNPLLPKTRSEIAVPIMAGEIVLGVLDVQNNIVNSLEQQDTILLRTIADQVAIALQNIATTETVTKRADELQKVAKISATTSALIEGEQQMLAQLVHDTQRQFGLYHAHVFTYDDRTRMLQIEACGWKEGDEHEGTHGTTHIPFDQAQSLVARAAHTRQPVIVNNVYEDPGWLPNPQLPDTHSELAVPLLVGDTLIGVLDVQSDRVNAFTEEDASIYSILAAQIAIAVQNARIFEQTRKRAEREALLSSINQKIQSTTTVESALKITVRELGRVLGTQAQVKLKSASGQEAMDTTVEESRS